LKILDELAKPPVKNIFRENELDVIALDAEFLYCYSDVKLPEWLCESFKLKIYVSYKENEMEERIKTKIAKTLEKDAERIVFRKILVSSKKESGMLISYRLPVFMKLNDKDGSETYLSVYPFERYGDVILDDKHLRIDLWRLIEYQEFLHPVEILERIENYYNAKLREMFKENPVYIK
jgi:hypothetical protein